MEVETAVEVVVWLTVVLPDEVAALAIRLRVWMREKSFLVCFGVGEICCQVS